MRACPSCGKTLEEVQNVRFGFHEGTLDGTAAGRSLCTLCGKGCYTWSESRNPGGGLLGASACCSCGNTPEEAEKSWLE